MVILKMISFYLLMILSLIGFLSGEIIKCDYNRKRNDSGSHVFEYTYRVSGICALLFWGLSIFDIRISLFTFTTALLFGIGVMGQIAASAFAMKIGPWAYTAVMMSLSTVIPALSGSIFWNETLTVNHILGIGLMLVCLILSVKNDRSDTNQKKNNLKWFLLSLIASLCTGGIGILQKLHQSSPYKNELITFLSIAFTTSACFNFFMTRIFEKRSDSKRAVNKSALPLFFVAGVGTTLNHGINLYLSGAMESAVFFSIMSGGEMIFVTLASVLIFKERLSVRQWIGLVSGMVAVIFFCI
jgi:drug/metabolite transporter (DMT)-like permease